MTDWGYTTFCDDIRQEVGNKLTLVGTYLSELLFAGDDQVVLPKLCALTVLNFDPENVPAQIKLTIEKDDKTILAENVLELSSDATDKMEGDSRLADVSRFLSIRAVFMIVPFEMYEGFLRVRARYDGQEIRAGSLRLRRVAPQQG